MKRFYKRISALLLALTLVLPLTACQGKSTEPAHGIQIGEEQPYSAEALAYAERTVFATVIDIYRKAVLNQIPEKVEKRLAGYAQRICQITASKPVSEERYLWAIGRLAECSSDVVDELIALREGTSRDFEVTRRLYLDLASVFGADHVASMLYDCCLLIYDAKYERAMEKLEDYQYPWYQEEADAWAAEKTVFAESVGREDFSALVRCTTAMAELIKLGSTDLSGSFSNTELLEIIRHLDLSEIDVDAAGWSILLSRSLPKDTSSYRGKLAEAFRESNDLDRVAAVMGDTVKLLASMMDSLAPEDLDLLRAGKHDELFTALFARFEDADWALFETVTSVSLANGQYSELATAEYGAAYSEYLAGIRSIGLDALRASVGESTFYANLSDYLAGICPAMSYEVKQ